MHDQRLIDTHPLSVILGGRRDCLQVDRGRRLPESSVFAKQDPKQDDPHYQRHRTQHHSKKWPSQE
jgi:hypothetical protein